MMSGSRWGDYILRREVAHQEWLHLAVNAQGPSGAQMLMWKTGSLARVHLEAEKIFRDMRDVSYMCFMQQATAPPSVPHSKMMLNYARLAGMAQERIDASTSATEDLVEHFNQFQMKRQHIATPPIQQLTGGNFSSAEDHSADAERIDLDVIDEDDII